MSGSTAPETDIEMVRKDLLRPDVLAINKGGQKQIGLRKQIIDGACICLNIASTVTLVFLNKWWV